MGSSIRLGKLFGIPFRLNITWFIIFLLVTVSLSLYEFPRGYPFWPSWQYWVVGIATSLLFFASVLVHELAHSIIAVNSGIPVKSITLFVFGGVSEISKEAAHPGIELVMSAAGPLTSLALAALFAGLWWLTRGVSESLAALGIWLGRINLMLAIFNLMPAFPLDGGRVLRSLIWGATKDYRRSTHIASLVGQGIAYLMIFVGVMSLFGVGVFDRASGLWVAFIGWFLANAASSSYRQVVFRDLLKGFKAADLMVRDCPSIAPLMTLKELVQDYILPTSRRCFLVTENDRLGGIVTLHNIRGIPQERWDITTIGQIMTPIESLKTVNPDDEALAILERMDEGDINQMPVVSDGRVVGMISRDNVLHFIRTRSELGV